MEAGQSFKQEQSSYFLYRILEQILRGTWWKKSWGEKDIYKNKIKNENWKVFENPKIELLNFEQT